MIDTCDPVVACWYVILLKSSTVSLGFCSCEFQVLLCVCVWLAVLFALVINPNGLETWPHVLKLSGLPMVICLL